MFETTNQAFGFTFFFQVHLVLMLPSGVISSMAVEIPEVKRGLRWFL
jgi:hypothetical protein